MVNADESGLDDAVRWGHCSGTADGTAAT